MKLEFIWKLSFVLFCFVSRWRVKTSIGVFLHFVFFYFFYFSAQTKVERGKNCFVFFTVRNVQGNSVECMTCTEHHQNDWLDELMIWKMIGKMTLFYPLLYFPVLFCAFLHFSDVQPCLALFELEKNISNVSENEKHWTNL